MLCTLLEALPTLVGSLIDSCLSRFRIESALSCSSLISLSLAGKKPFTFGKAKRENIKHQRFPLDRYIKYVRTGYPSNTNTAFFPGSAEEVGKSWRLIKSTTFWWRWNIPDRGLKHSNASRKTSFSRVSSSRYWWSFAAIGNSSSVIKRKRNINNVTIYSRLNEQLFRLRDVLDGTVVLSSSRLLDDADKHRSKTNSRLITLVDLMTGYGNDHRLQLARACMVFVFDCEKKSPAMMYFVRRNR